MKKVISRRLEKLESAAGLNDETMDIRIVFVVRDVEGKRIISGGLRLIPGGGTEKLPASLFSKEESYEEA